MTLLFTIPDAWSGGFFELALELGPRSDERLRNALCELWRHPSLAGCYLERDLEPEDQATVDPRTLDFYEQALGVADIPGVGKTCCLSFVVREDDGPDWLTLAVPMGSLSEVVFTGAYPFEDGTDLSWRLLMYDWLRQVAAAVFEAVPFQLGLIEHEASGEFHAEDLRRNGIPDERWVGYLWPGNKGLEWYPPTEGAPFSF